jgi:hypothetical protein
VIILFLVSVKKFQISQLLSNCTHTSFFGVNSAKSTSIYSRLTVWSARVYLRGGGRESKKEQKLALIRSLIALAPTYYFSKKESFFPKKAFFAGETDCLVVVVVDIKSNHHHHHRKLQHAGIFSCQIMKRERAIK